LPFLSLLAFLPCFLWFQKKTAFRCFLLKKTRVLVVFEKKTLKQTSAIHCGTQANLHGLSQHRKKQQRPIEKKDTRPSQTKTTLCLQSSSGELLGAGITSEIDFQTHTVVCMKRKKALDENIKFFELFSN